MISLRDSCDRLGVTCPPEVEQFFKQHEDDCDAEEEVREINLTPLHGGFAGVTRLPDSYGYEINVKALPDSVKFLCIEYD